jgi:hypothetical protein
MIRNTLQFYKNGENGQDIYYNYSHFVRPYQNFSLRKLLIIEDVQSMDREEWLCLTVSNANGPSSAGICLHSSVIVSLVN